MVASSEKRSLPASSGSRNSEERSSSARRCLHLLGGDPLALAQQQHAEQARARLLREALHERPQPRLGFGDGVACARAARRARRSASVRQAGAKSSRIGTWRMLDAAGRRRAGAAPSAREVVGAERARSRPRARPRSPAAAPAAAGSRASPRGPTPRAAAWRCCAAWPGGRPSWSQSCEPAQPRAGRASRRLLRLHASDSPRETTTRPRSIRVCERAQHLVVGVAAVLDDVARRARTSRAAAALPASPDARACGISLFGDRQPHSRLARRQRGVASPSSSRWRRPSSSSTRVGPDRLCVGRAALGGEGEAALAPAEQPEQRLLARSPRCRPWRGRARRPASQTRAGLARPRRRARARARSRRCGGSGGAAGSDRRAGSARAGPRARGAPRSRGARRPCASGAPASRRPAPRSPRPASGPAASRRRGSAAAPAGGRGTGSAPRRCAGSRAGSPRARIPSISGSSTAAIDAAAARRPAPPRARRGRSRRGAPARPSGEAGLEHALRARAVAVRDEHRASH